MVLVLIISKMFSVAVVRYSLDFHNYVFEMSLNCEFHISGYTGGTFNMMDLNALFH